MIPQDKPTFKVKRKTGGNMWNETPIFYDRDKVLLVPSGSSLYFYNTVTGDRLPHVVHCEHRIISCQLHPCDRQKAIVCASSGEIIIFKRTTDHLEEQKVQLSLEGYKPDELNKSGSNPTAPIFQQIELTYNQDLKNLGVLASWNYGHKGNTYIGIFHSKSGSLNKSSVTSYTRHKNHKSFAIIHNQILAVMGSDFVLLYELSINKLTFIIKHFIGLEKELEYIIPHPLNQSFATGDSLGRLIVWNNIFKKSPLKSEYHWHSLPVRCLMYSADASHIYSGGEENVLVKWSTHSQHKSFLPRLSAPIINLSRTDNNSMISVSTLDSRIIIMNSNFDCLCTIQHFSSWSAFDVYGGMKGVLTTDPKTNAIVMNGRIGHLQFLSSNENGKFLYTLDITNRNVVSGDDPNSKYFMLVSHARFSQSGLWLVTAEEQNKSMLIAESHLKFWQFDEIKQQFSLNTDISAPHEKDILSLEYGRGDLVVTTGSDQTFKLWSPQEMNQVEEIKIFWTCCGIGSYKNLSPLPSDFSIDSSLVAVGFGPMLTLWNTDDCQLKCSLTPSFSRHNIKLLKFGNFECSHLIITATDINVCSWNLVTLTRMWSVPINITVLASDPSSSTLAAFSARNSLFLFKPSSPNILFQVSECSASKITSAVYILQSKTTDSFSKNYQLYFLNEEQELLTLEEDEEETELLFKDIPVSQTVLGSLVAANKKTDVARIKDSQYEHSKYDAKLFNQIVLSPAHTLPRVSMLCFDLLKQLTLKESTKPKSNSFRENSLRDINEITKKEVERKKLDLEMMFNRLFTKS